MADIIKWRPKARKVNPVTAADARVVVMLNLAREIQSARREHGGFSEDEILESAVRQVCLRYEGILGRIGR